MNLTVIDSSKLRGRTAHWLLMGFVSAFFICFSQMYTLLAQDGQAPSKPGSEAALIEIKPKTLQLIKDTSLWVMSRVKVLNRGAAPLQLAEINASCGCASATVMKNPVQPMDVGELLIRINTENLKDSVNVIEYTVNSNASNSPYLFRVVVRNPAAATK